MATAKQFFQDAIKFLPSPSSRTPEQKYQYDMAHGLALMADAQERILSELMDLDRKVRSLEADVRRLR